MKVIFLDIDGVLNSNDWYVKTRGIGGYSNGCSISLFRWGCRRYDEVTIKKL